MDSQSVDRRSGPAEAPDAPRWWVFRDREAPPGAADPEPELPPAPPWRIFGGGGAEPLEPPVDGAAPDGLRRLGTARGRTLDPSVVEIVNAAIHLRRPLLVTGSPGTGKSSLAHQIAAELRLGPVLWWPVVSRSTLRDGLYDYDAIGRVQDAPRGPDAAVGPLPDVGAYVTLGPLGTALLPWRRPRVLLIDELDKSDIDLPNDLLHVFEEGEFRIRELQRVAGRQAEVPVLTADHGDPVTISKGHVRCREFPVVVITSNGEREFPPAFRRRCLEVQMPDPGPERLAAMVEAHFGRRDEETAQLIGSFLARGKDGRAPAADRLLNTVHMLSNREAMPDRESWDRLCGALWDSANQEPSA
ncbi:AAA family ATPase [Streptomyces sp. NPDC049040]|uniref:AAA family ATPase n=1 Tax=Streptomyces sp. NPDC049040 TaxID=3365593 RepID=UPI003711A378